MAPTLELSEQVLFDFLKQQEMPVLETTLLRNFFPEDNNRSFRELDLNVVQMHFILYHHLYKLAHSLNQSNYLLYIYYIYVYLLKKPNPHYCPYFDKSTIRFCLAGKKSEQKYCHYHHEKELSLSQKHLLVTKGIEEYYLDFENFYNLELEYVEILNRAQKIKKYALISDELEESYQILGLFHGSSLDRVQIKYKVLAKQYHPDLNPSSDANQKFKIITKAYNTLKDFLTA